jgi:hypothetical protein
MNNIELSSPLEKGSLGIMHLKRFWEKSMAKRDGRLSQQAFQEEWNLDFTLLNALGLGLEQTIKHLYQEKPGFEEFEEWIVQLNSGKVPYHSIRDFNQLVSADQDRQPKEGRITNFLDENEIEFWDRNGYVIIREAVAKEDCSLTVELICEFLSIDINDSSSWYLPHPGRQGIMVQMFQHPQLEKNRRSQKIRGAYEQLWGRTDLWCNTDRVSFNPPENEEWRFPGPRLHWDVSLDLPIPFGLQGLLYLSDTQRNQGAFTLVPGFHLKIESWINGLPPGSNPRTEDIYKLGPVPIAANAGDFIIWHQALPHGSSPNTSTRPRIVQYINYLPLDPGIREKWK